MATSETENQEWKEGTGTGGNETSDEVDADPIRSLPGKTPNGHQSVKKTRPATTGPRPA